MKAMVINEFGGPEVFTPAEIADPAPGRGEVVIRVAASSVNPIDAKIRSGAVAAVAPPFPAVLHGDVAGIVERVGDGVDHLSVGEEVFACAGGVKGCGGALSERMIADAESVAAKPVSLSMIEAGVLPLVGITAWQAILERARVRPAQRVLIHGGAGGVGHLAVQLAKAAGAIVHATVSDEDKARVARQCGADETINYRQADVQQYVDAHTGGEGYDVVFDTVGGDNLPRSFAATRTGGTVVTIAARSTQDLSPLHAKNLTFHCVFMLLPLLTGHDRARHRGILQRLARLADSGMIRPIVDPTTHAFADVAAAHRRLEAGDAIGKIALTPDF